MRRDVISLVLSIAVVGGGALWVQRSNAAVERELQRLVVLASQPARDPAARCVMAVDTELVRGELRRALSSVSLAPDSSACAPVSSDTARAAEPSPADAPAPSPDAVAAFDEAGTVLETSLSRGAWTSDDALKFRLLLARLDPEERRTLSLRLVKAMNGGKLRPTGTRREIF